IRRESLSLLAYVRQSYPWTNRQSSEKRDRVLAILDEEYHQLAALGQYLTRHHVPIPTHGSFPADFTTVNFVALKHLIPRLVEAERDSIADLEGDIVAVTEPGYRAKVEQILGVKQQHLKELESMQAPEPATV